jgi:hypothetical protein
MTQKWTSSQPICPKNHPNVGKSTIHGASGQESKQQKIEGLRRNDSDWLVILGNFHGENEVAICWNWSPSPKRNM